MAKQIDFENLTADDKQYFDDRPWLKDDYERHTGNKFSDLDFNLPDDEDDEQDDGSQQNPQSSPVDDFPSYADRPRPDGWDTFSDEEKRAYIYTQPDEVKSNGAGSSDADADEPVAPYSEWDYQVLKEEVAERELDVADQKKETLVAALEADDEAENE